MGLNKDKGEIRVFFGIGVSFFENISARLRVKYLFFRKFYLPDFGIIDANVITIGRILITDLNMKILVFVQKFRF